MNDLTVAILGYICGALTGGFILLVILTYVYLYTKEIKIQDTEYIADIQEIFIILSNENTTIFTVSFIIGFLNGTGVFAKILS